MQTCSNTSLQQASPKRKIPFQWAKDKTVLHLQTASPFRTTLCAISALESQPLKTGIMQLRGCRHKGFGFTTYFPYCSTRSASRTPVAQVLQCLPVSDSGVCALLPHAQGIHARNAAAVCGIAYAQRKHFPQEQTELRIHTCALLLRQLALNR